MNIESRFGANKGGWQPSQLSYLASRKNALRAHTLTGQVFEKTPRKTSVNSRISNRFWSKNRSYRKQMTKPCLTGTRIARRELQLSSLGEPNFAISMSLATPQIQRAVPGSDRDKRSPLPC